MAGKLGISVEVLCTSIIDAHTQTRLDIQSEAENAGTTYVDVADYAENYDNPESSPLLRRLDTIPPLTLHRQDEVIFSDGSSTQNITSTGIVTLYPNNLSLNNKGTQTNKVHIRLPPQLGTLVPSARDAELWGLIRALVATSVTVSHNAPIIMDARAELHKAIKLQALPTASGRQLLKGTNLAWERRLKLLLRQPNQTSPWIEKLSPFCNENFQIELQSADTVICWQRAHTNDHQNKKHNAENTQSSFLVHGNSLADAATKSNFTTPPMAYVKYPQGLPFVILSIKGNAVCSSLSVGIRNLLHTASLAAWSKTSRQGKIATCINTLSRIGTNLAEFSKVTLPPALASEWCGTWINQEKSIVQLDIICQKIRCYIQGSYTARLHYDVRFRRKAEHLFDKSTLELCPFCSTRGTFRHYMLICPHPALKEIRDKLFVMIERKTAALVEGTRQNVIHPSCHPSMIVDDQPLYPTLCAIPALIPSTREDILNENPSQETANDLMYRAVLSSSFVNYCLNGSKLTLHKKQEFFEILVTIVVFAYSIRTKVQQELDLQINRWYDDSLHNNMLQNSRYSSQNLPTYYISGVDIPCQGSLCVSEHMTTLLPRHPIVFKQLMMCKRCYELFNDQCFAMRFSSRLNSYRNRHIWDSNRTHHQLSLSANALRFAATSHVDVLCATLHACGIEHQLKPKCQCKKPPVSHRGKRASTIATLCSYKTPSQQARFCHLMLGRPYDSVFQIPLSCLPTLSKSQLAETLTIRLNWQGNKPANIANHVIFQYARHMHSKGNHNVFSAILYSDVLHPLECHLKVACKEIPLTATKSIANYLLTHPLILTQRHCSDLLSRSTALIAPPPPHLIHLAELHEDLSLDAPTLISTFNSSSLSHHFSNMHQKENSQVGRFFNAVFNSVLRQDNLALSESLLRSLMNDFFHT